MCLKSIPKKTILILCFHNFLKGVCWYSDVRDMLVRKTNKIGLQIDVSERDFNQIPPPPKHQLKDPIVAKGSKNSQTSKNHPGTIRWLHDWTTLQRFKVILYDDCRLEFPAVANVKFSSDSKLETPKFPAVQSCVSKNLGICTFGCSVASCDFSIL